MKKHSYAFVLLMLAVGLSGCGDNKTSQKLIGTNIISTDTSGTTIQNAVAQQTLEQITPKLFATMKLGMSVPGLASSPLKAATQVSQNFNFTLGGGTLGLVVNATVSSSYSSGAGTIATVAEIASTFTGVTITMNGKNYTVSGHGADHSTFNTSYTVANDYLTALSDTFSIARVGSITITGQDCNGTWDYNTSSNGSISLVASVPVGTTSTYSGTVTHNGVIAGLGWHETIPISVTSGS